MINIGHMFAVAYFDENVLPIIVGQVNSVVAASSSASCVNFKTAWQAGVIGAFAGGVSTAYAVAVAGTVVIPVFGTITGALSGFIFGFAGGFATGAVSSIAQDLFFKCLLKSTRQTSGDEQCQDFDFYFDHPEWCDEYYHDRKYWWSLVNG
jgi:hypothetical protein